jgi:hypothetical protein
MLMYLGSPNSAETRFEALICCGAPSAHCSTSPVSFQTTPDDRLEMRVESVGKVHPHVRAKVIDQHGAIVPVGEHIFWTRYYEGPVV